MNPMPQSSSSSPEALRSASVALAGASCPAACKPSVPNWGVDSADEIAEATVGRFSPRSLRMPVCSTSLLAPQHLTMPARSACNRREALSSATHAYLGWSAAGGSRFGVAERRQFRRCFVEWCRHAAAATWRGPCSGFPVIDFWRNQNVAPADGSELRAEDQDRRPRPLTVPQTQLQPRNRPPRGHPPGPSLPVPGAPPTTHQCRFAVTQSADVTASVAHAAKRSRVQYLVPRPAVPKFSFFLHPRRTIDETPRESSASISTACARAAVQCVVPGRGALVPLRCRGRCPTPRTGERR